MEVSIEKEIYVDLDEVFDKLSYPDQKEFLVDKIKYVFTNPQEFAEECLTTSQITEIVEENLTLASEEALIDALENRGYNPVNLTTHEEEN